jgi:hypothetical protein
VIVGFGASEFGGPQWDQVKADCQASAGDKCFVTLGFVVGYSNADFFIQVAKELESREASDGWEFNAENFVGILNSGYAHPGFGNVYGPTNWPDDRNQNNLCAALVQVDGTSFTPIADLDCGNEYVPFEVLK